MDIFFRFQNLGNFHGIVHAVTKKSNTCAYGFSMALHTGEDPDSVVTNRRKAASMLGDDKAWEFVLADQTHGDHIAIIDKKQSMGWQDRESAVAHCDALVTDQKGVMLGILTADCVPILLYDPKHKVVGAIHAGWKGSVAGITAKCVALMQREFNSNPSEIIAGIAPSIGGCCYEVGSEVAAYFADYEGALRPKGEKYMLDLPEVNRLQLIDAGVPAFQIERSGICTACHEDDFFSYRKTQGCSGRFMSMIGLKLDPRSDTTAMGLE